MSVNTCDDSKQKRLIRRINELYHDLQSDQFDGLHQRRHAIERRFWESEVVPRLAAAGFRFGVDLCTGTGFVPRILMEHLDRSVRVLCIDISDKALLEARKRLIAENKKIDWHVGDVSAIPLTDCSADWITLNAGLHHLPEPEAVLREIDRVLKPGGYFCLGYEPNTLFFSCRPVYLLERTVWHLFWYFSPVRNWLRIQRFLRLRSNTCQQPDHLIEINRSLIEEKLIDQSISLEDIRRLVDLHTHEKESKNAGFHPGELISRHFPKYSVEVFKCTDYGGEMLQGHRWLRWTVDTIMRVSCDRKGMLFSFVLRKPLAGNDA